MSPQFRVALLRALVASFLGAVTAFLALWSRTDDPKTLAIATATAFFSPLVVRFGGEGAYDTLRNFMGLSHAGDVTPNTQTVHLGYLPAEPPPATADAPVWTVTYPGQTVVATAGE